MRTDENGKSCPETLGEYRDTMFSLVRDENNPAVKFLDEKIEKEGRDEVVLAADSQMRFVLFGLMRKGLRNADRG